MDSIVAKLLDIENTAEAIVAHAESQKPVIEQEIQAKREQFDADLEKKTQEKLDVIRTQLKAETNRVLDEQREKNKKFITKLRNDYETNHTAYAKQIISQITEV